MDRADLKVCFGIRFWSEKDRIAYGPVREHPDGEKMWALGRKTYCYFSYSYSNMRHLISSQNNFQSFMFLSKETYSGM